MKAHYIHALLQMITAMVFQQKMFKVRSYRLRSLPYPQKHSYFLRVLIKVDNGAAVPIAGSISIGVAFYLRMRLKYFYDFFFQLALA